MRAPLRNVIVASALAVSVGPACLGTLPDAVQCPPAPVYGFCPSAQSIGTSPVPSPSPSPSSPTPGGTGSGPVAPVGGPNCNLPGACYVNQGRTCVCSSAAECTRTSTTCSPAPDCPQTVRAAAGAGATCIEMTGTFLPSSSAPGCTCGCASCAMYCDGQGPVLGSDQTIRLSFPSSLPSSGRLAVMVRMRGSGVAVVSTEDRPLGQAPGTPEFRDMLLVSDQAGYAWTNDAQRPNALLFHAMEGSLLEVDCIVPFLVR